MLPKPIATGHSFAKDGIYTCSTLYRAQHSAATRYQRKTFSKVLGDTTRKGPFATIRKTSIVVAEKRHGLLHLQLQIKPDVQYLHREAI